MTEVVKADIPEIEQPKAEQPGEAVSASNDDDQKPVFNKYQVRDVVKREQQKAYEKGKREALMDLQNQQAGNQTVQPQPTPMQAPVPQQQPQQAPSIGGIQQMSPEQIRQMIAQETPKAFQDHARALQQQQLVNSFVSKMQAAEAKYPGMEKKLNELDYSTIAPLIHHIDKMENTADIMHELIHNPMKMGNIISLLYTQPKLAEEAVRNLSASIKTNTDAAAQEKSANEPFGQIKPSNNSSKDDGEMTVADFQKMFRKKK